MSEYEIGKEVAEIDRRVRIIEQILNEVLKPKDATAATTNKPAI